MPKPTKLRESCDSCLIAKVKCSKTRPVCVRCLGNGATCGYSPSSRAGRKTRSAVATEAAKTSRKYDTTTEPAEITPPTPSYIPLMQHPIVENQDGSIVHPNSIFHRPNSSLPRENPSRRHSVIENRVSMTQGAADLTDFFQSPPFSEDFGDTFLQFSPQTYLQDPNHPNAASPRNSNCPDPAISAWTPNGSPYHPFSPLQFPDDLVSFDQGSSSHLASSPEIPALEGDNSQLLVPPGGEAKSTCDCFAVCLQALQTLHNHSWTPASAQPGGLPFDVVLNINREAMRGCATMLDCEKCVSQSGSSISTMLLATIFGKIISLYGSACLFRFGPSPRNQAVVKLAFGAYTLTGEDRRLLEMEIILLELRKVESILLSYHERFRDAQAEKDESSVYNALTCYLDKNLRYILDFLQARKGGTCK